VRGKGVFQGDTRRPVDQVGEKLPADGLAALASLDATQGGGNADGVFDDQDAAYTTLRVWVDANHDGKSFVDVNGNGTYEAGTDTTELKTLGELGIISISLSGTSQSGLVRDGNEVLATATFTQNVDGEGLGVPVGTPGSTQVSREAVAASFLADPSGHTFAASGTGLLTTTEGDVKSYGALDPDGESIDVAAKGVQNAYGAEGNDTLTGDATNNWLAGGLGSDAFDAGAGDDVLLIDAADAEENIHAGDGMDIVQVVGDSGVVLNLSEAEVEIVQGGRGDDIFIGGGRSSVFVSGAEGDDILIGGAASDALSGEEGDDLIDGGQGNDIVRGHRGADVVLGGAGDDLVEGGLGEDSLSGGTGNDVLRGGQGDDSLDGGDGTDVAEYSGSYADYRITWMEEGFFIADSAAGRDGTDFVANVEKLTFRDISLIETDLVSPMPVRDVLGVDKTGAAIERDAATLRIGQAQLVANDKDFQGGTLTVTAVSDWSGGTASIEGGTEDIIFTPSAGFDGVLGFKYTIKDAQNNLAAQVVDLSSGETAKARWRIPTAVVIPAGDCGGGGIRSALTGQESFPLGGGVARWRRIS